MVEFGTSGIRGDVTTRVEPELVAQIARALAIEEDRVVLARDGRTTSEALASAGAAGIASGGGEVLWLGTVPTPVLAYASRGDAGLMITASHNPPSDNGVKIFIDGHEAPEALEQRIESRCKASRQPVRWNQWPPTRSVHLLDKYRSEISDFVSGMGSTPAEQMIAIDCGNGPTGKTTPAVLRDHNLNVTTLNGRIDGRFPARASKPAPDVITDLCSFVTQTEATMGIAHDGDGDRFVLVDETGNIVHEDTVIAVIAGYLVTHSAAPDPVVLTTPNTSRRIDDHVHHCGGHVERTPLGKLYQGLETFDTDDATVVFAAEPWKHLYPSLGPWVDATVSAVLIPRLAAEFGGLDALTAPIASPPYEKRSISCPHGAKTEVMSWIQDELPTVYSDAVPDMSHGLTLTWSEFEWLLVRPSGTEPYIRLYGEGSQIESRLDEIVELLKAIIQDIEGC